MRVFHDGSRNESRRKGAGFSLGIGQKSSSGFKVYGSWSKMGKSYGSWKCKNPKSNKDFWLAPFLSARIFAATVNSWFNGLGGDEQISN